jgi:hypothetical protein
MDCKQECAKKYICKSHPNDCGVCMAVSFFGNRYPLFKEKDIVEVVRCKDCVCFNNNMPTRPFCDHFGAVIDLMHFCSYGKRKDS